jgi:hypothetical protein
MTPETPQQPNQPPDSETQAPKPTKSPPNTLAGGKPARKGKKPTPHEHGDATIAKDVVGPSAVRAPVRASGEKKKPPTSVSVLAGRTDEHPSPSGDQTSTTSVDIDAAVAVVPNTPTATPVTPDDVQGAFDAECETIRRQVIANDVAYALGWYPIADAVAALRDRYQGRLQNIAAAIGAAIGRSERAIYILYRIAEHPQELRGRVREVGLGEDQGRLVQLAGLASETRDAALEAFGEGGPAAFDAVAKGTTRNAALAALLAQIADPKQALGGIAAKDPKKPLPTNLKEQFPELAQYATFGDVLRVATAPSASQSDGSAEKRPSKKEEGKPKPERDWQKGFDLPVATEKTVTLRKAEFKLVLVHVVDAEGNEIKGAKAKIQVLDQT